MRHPSSTEKINYIKNFIADPCDSPWEMYVEVAIPALLRAVVSYYCLDMMQIFTGYVRPHQALKGIRGKGHSRSSRKNKRPRTWLKHWQKWSSFDPWDSIGRNLPGANDLGGRDVGGGTKFAWYFYGQIERVNHMVMVYSIVEDFFYNWSAGMTATVYCQEAQRPWCTAFKTGDGHLPILGDTPMVVGEVIKARHTTIAAGNAIGVIGSRSSATFSGTFRPWVTGDSVAGAQLKIVHETGITVFSEPAVEGQTGVGLSGSAGEEGAWFFFGTGPTAFWLDDGFKNVSGEAPGKPVDYPWNDNPCSASGSWKPTDWVESPV